MARQHIRRRQLQGGLGARRAVQDVVQDLLPDGVGVGGGVVGDHHDRRLQLRHAQELGLVAGPQPAMAHGPHATHGGKPQPAGVVVQAAVGEGRAFLQLRRQPMPVRLAGPRPQREVNNGGHQRPLAMHGKPVLRLHPGPHAIGRIGRQIPGRQPRHELRGRFHHPRHAHARGGKQPLGQEIAQLHAAGPLRDHAQQHEPGIGIQIPAPRREIQRALPGDPGQQLLMARRHRKVGAAGAHDLQHVANAGGIPHHVVNRDDPAEVRKLRHMQPNIVGKREPALLRQQQDRRTGELLAHRGNAEGGPLPDRQPQLDARQPAAFVQHQLLPAHDPDGNARPGGLAPGGQQGGDVAVQQGGVQIGHGGILGAWMATT